MRPRLVLLGIVGLSFVVADVLALRYLSADGVPSPERCAELWNATGNTTNRAKAAAGFERAVVYGWLAKDTYPGCAILVHGENGKPWLSFGGQVHAGRVDAWSVAGGLRWGSDSPEGGPEAPNATLTSDGHARLIGS